MSREGERKELRGGCQAAPGDVQYYSPAPGETCDVRNNPWPREKVSTCILKGQDFPKEAEK